MYAHPPPPPPPPTILLRVKILQNNRKPTSSANQHHQHHLKVHLHYNFLTIFLIIEKSGFMFHGVLSFCAFFLPFSSDVNLYFSIILKPKSIRFPKNSREQTFR